MPGYQGHNTGNYLMEDGLGRIGNNHIHIHEVPWKGQKLYACHGFRVTEVPGDEYGTGDPNVCVEMERDPKLLRGDLQAWRTQKGIPRSP